MTTEDIGLVAPIRDGKVEYTPSKETTKKETVKGSGELGKDAFLQLLVAQMKYQDPLDPSDNSEYIAQLATFSQLEQLQNLNSEYEKSQAFSLIGKHVVLKVTDSNGSTTYPEGVVDYVNLSGTKVTLKVNGATYSYDQLMSVEDDEFYKTKNNPTVSSDVDFSFNANEPEDMSFTVDYGYNDQKATEATLVFGNQILDSGYVSYRDNVVTIAKEALMLLPNGEYKPSVVFNNKDFTEVSGKIKITVFNSDAKPQVGTEEESTPAETEA